MVRSLFLPLALAALLQAGLAGAQPAAPGALVMDQKLAVQLPEGTPDASERRVLLERLDRDQLRLVADGGRQTAQLAALREELRTVHQERSRLLEWAGALATLLATLLTSLALWFVLCRKRTARGRTTGAWYRPAPLRPQPGRTPQAALSPVSWTIEEGAATLPLVREFGRGPAPKQRASG